MSTNDPGRSEPEYLGTGGPTSEAAESSVDRRGKRTGLIAGAAVAVAAALGVGSYGLLQLLAGGDAPASAVPADALAYVSLDLDPSAAQKIEAIKIARKFPALKEQMHFGSRDDLRRELFDQITKENDCSGLDYDRDVEPWIGNRVALAAVPDEKKIALPLVVLQVSDQAKAKAGIKKLLACDTSGDTDQLGISFVGDYVLLTEGQSNADRMATDAEGATLEDDGDFQTWMDRAGDPGIVTMYAAKDAAAALLKGQERQSRMHLEEFRDGTDNAPSVDPFGGGDAPWRSVLKDFQGAAGVIRFHDGALEAEFSTKGLQGQGSASSGSGEAASTLPSSTAATLSIAFHRGWLDDQIDRLDEREKSFGDGANGPSLEDLMREGEQRTGLRLPEDIETLLGDGVTVSVDAGADLEALSESPDPSKVPAGIRIQGDPEAIIPIIDKLKAAAGPQADAVEVRGGDGKVAVGLDGAYLQKLLQKGDLGGNAQFRDVVPEADRATALFYVNFDAGDGWVEQLADLLSDGDPGARENVAPLEALGVSAWLDDDKVAHSLVRLTTD